MSNVNMRRFILFPTEKEEPVSTDAQQDWHKPSLLLRRQFSKAAVGRVASY